MSDEVRLVCQKCGDEGAERRRQNTAYCEDDRNYVTLCPACHLENDLHWREMWADYYGGCL